jgi:hypothetical protein
MRAVRSVTTLTGQRCDIEKSAVMPTTSATEACSTILFFVDFGFRTINHIAYNTVSAIWRKKVCCDG